MSLDGSIALWATVVAFGAYHGLNPAMGWPLAVASGLSAGRESAVLAALMPLAAGHLIAMAAVLLPFALLTELVAHRQAVQVGAGSLVLLFGVYKLVNRRHARYLARIPPTQLAWWSFSMAMAHGAGLMLVPVALGLCVAAPAGTNGASAVDSLLRSNLATAVQVAMVHTAAMLLTGMAIAWACYRFLGLQFVRRAWFNLDLLWGASLVLAGGVACAVAVWAPH